MRIEPIIYETTRSIQNLGDKLSIAVIVLFCWKLGSRTFADLLYTYDHEAFIKSLSEDYKYYGVDFTVNLSDRDIKRAFYDTLQKVKDKYDDDGFFKALHEGDEYAIACCNIADAVTGFDKVKFGNAIQELKGQLSLNF